MDLTKWLFWNVDTQIDFVNPNGKLYVPGAEKLQPKWKELTRLAEKMSIRVVNTADYHYANSPEIDSSPDFINTFPEHCMADTPGADYVRETEPEDPVIFNWNKEYTITPELFEKANRNFIIRKDTFDIFSGNPYADVILNCLNPEIIVVYGVATNVCVDAEARSLVTRGKKVYVVEDAIKELPDIPLPFDIWREIGIQLVTVNDLRKMLEGD